MMRILEQEEFASLRLLGVTVKFPSCTLGRNSKSLAFQIIDARERRIRSNLFAPQSHTASWITIAAKTSHDPAIMNANWTVDYGCSGEKVGGENAYGCSAEQVSGENTAQ